MTNHQNNEAQFPRYRKERHTKTFVDDIDAVSPHRCTAHQQEVITPISPQPQTHPKSLQTQLHHMHPNPITKVCKSLVTPPLCNGRAKEENLLLRGNLEKGPFAEKGFLLILNVNMM